MLIKRKIAEGINLNYIEDKRFKVNRVSIKFLLPLQTSKNSSRSLIFPVIIRGTENYPTEKDISIELENLYCSSVNSSYSRQGNISVQTLNVSFLRKKYIQDDTDVESGVLKLVEDVLVHPLTENGTFKCKNVEIEKSHLADSVRAEINNKGKYAINQCVRNMMSDDPFGYPINGTVDDIEKVTPKDVYEEYQSMLRTAKIEIFISGDVEMEKYADFFKNIFTAIDRNCCQDLEPLPVKTHVGEVKRIREKDNVVQGKMVIGFRAFCSNEDSLDDIIPFLVGLNVFGSGSTNKLFDNVREKMSLCYYCSALFIADKGLMIVQSGVAKENEEKAFKAIIEQLEKMKNGDIEEKEIENAKSDSISEIVAIFDYSKSIIAWNYEKMFYSKPLDPDEYIDRIKKVTKEQISDKFKKVELDTYYFLCGGDD